MAAPVLQATARLNDGVSGVLRSMITQTNALMTRFERMDRVMRNLGTGNRGVRQLTQELEASRQRTQRLEQRAGELTSRFRAATQQITAMRERLSATEQEMKSLTARVAELERKMEEANKRQKGFNAGISSGNSAMKQMLSTVMSIATVYAGIRGAKWVTGESDQYVSTQARLKLINDNLQTQEELQNAIFAAARRSRAEYDSFAASTAKLGLLAGDAFDNNSELIYFMETLQKAFKVSGASTSESINAMYQLTQAMAAGKLQGDEFRSIMENAPMLADSIEKYMKNAGVEGAMKDWSREGLITSDIIKTALFNAADDINAKFATLPMTFSDMWNQTGTTATQVFAPLWERINASLNTAIGGENFQGITQMLQTGALYANNFFTQMQLLGQSAGPLLSTIKNEFGGVIHYILSANGLLGTMTNTLSKIARSKGGAQFFTVLAKGAQTLASGISWVVRQIGWLSENFKVFLPTLSGVIVGFTTFKLLNATLYPALQSVGTAIMAMKANIASLTASLTAATTAQEALNAALSANVFGAAAKAILPLIAALGSLAAGIAAVNKAAGLAAESQAIGGITYEAIELGNRMGYSYSTAQSIIDAQNQAADREKELLASIAAAEKAKEATGYSQYLKDYQLANGNARKALFEQVKAAEPEFRAQEALIAQYRQELYQSGIVEATAINSYREMDRNLKAVNSEMEGIAGSIGGDISSTLAGIGADTSRIANAVDISKENLQYMRDNAERETINRFTTAEIKVDMTNNNNITNQNDVDGLMTAFGIRMQEELDATAERSYQF